MIDTNEEKIVAKESGKENKKRELNLKSTSL